MFIKRLGRAPRQTLARIYHRPRQGNYFFERQLIPRASTDKSAELYIRVATCHNIANNLF